ncbi:MAG: chorismate mutase [Pseudobdellovibrionaceae bacterium]|jgi:chorismate mutase-like protein|nr:chorismate mutase [Pseudobdellovibrionaceae bacterium]
MYQSIPLDQIRQKIDSLDNQIHDLLMERADLIMAISEEKKKAGIQIVQPAREARMIRRLMARHRGPLPEETIVRIWRELVSSVSLLQTGLSVAVYVPHSIPEYWDMARDYFGSVLPMQRCENPFTALNLVREGKITFAVLPYPEISDNTDDTWWHALIDAIEKEEGISIIQRLPYGDKENYNFELHPSLVISKSKFGPSDDDYSLVGIKTIDDVSRGKIMEHIEKAGFEGSRLFGASKYFIFSTQEYLTSESDKLCILQESLSNAGEVLLLGGYPSPLVFHNMVKNKTAE